mmetsp:Transcript_8452/g.34354  ORF Transcript_8452/g.34354 Transcript_8452/m.34354 type:complete len:298 (+) Transcript_8452:928-1821(+)
MTKVARTESLAAAGLAADHGLRGGTREHAHDVRGALAIATAHQHARYDLLGTVLKRGRDNRLNGVVQEVVEGELREELETARQRATFNHGGHCGLATALNDIGDELNDAQTVRAERCLQRHKCRQQLLRVRLPVQARHQPWQPLKALRNHLGCRQLALHIGHDALHAGHARERHLRVNVHCRRRRARLQDGDDDLRGVCEQLLARGVHHLVLFVRLRLGPIGAPLTLARALAAALALGGLLLLRALRLGLNDDLVVLVIGFRGCRGRRSRRGRRRCVRLREPRVYESADERRLGELQ